VSFRSFSAETELPIFNCRKPNLQELNKPAQNNFKSGLYTALNMFGLGFFFSKNAIESVAWTELQSKACFSNLQNNFSC